MVAGAVGVADIVTVPEPQRVAGAVDANVGVFTICRYALDV